jgi:release factor glutamine methyltransferase
MTVLEVIQRSAEFLAKKAVDSPRLQAELLLAHVLKLPRMQLYLNFERTLSPAELDAVRDLIKRRSRREPLQQIVGSTSFCGLEIAVNRHVLVPRPETELLAERAWQFLNQLPLSQAGATTALDFGTGSGCLAVLLACKAPAARVFALDISAEALDVARQNASQHGLAGRITFLHRNGLAGIATDGPDSLPAFNLIVSNPPYIPTAEIRVLQAEVSDFEPVAALDGGPDGLEYFRHLAREAGALLLPGGRIMLEFGDGQADSVRQLFEQQKWIVESIQADYTQRPRILVARREPL